MARASKYKWDKGDEVGLYRVIKVLPSEPNVKNLVIWCECLLCGERCKRWSNRLDSRHRGCTAPKKVEIVEPEPVPVVELKRHTRADGRVVETNEYGNVVGESDPVALTDDDSEDLELGDLSLSAEIVQALNFDVDAYAMELIKKAESLDPDSRLLFFTTLRRYLTLVHVARKIERKLARSDELTVAGSNGNQVANPLLTQYKAISSESNQTARALHNMLTKFKSAEAEDDPLAKALAGVGNGG